MEKNKYVISSFILAVGISLLGYFIYCGFTTVVNSRRTVTVKGLSELTVNADKVTWPIMTKEVGNDLQALYNKMDERQKIIKDFLISGGLTDKDIFIDAPDAEDNNTNSYYSSDSKLKYRYSMSVTITVMSNEVEKVRKLMARQGELIKKGITYVNDTYEHPITYEYVSFADKKENMMAEAISNAESTAKQFAENSHSKLNKIESASQGQFSIEDVDATTPYIKEIRVVTTITYSLKD